MVHNLFMIYSLPLPYLDLVMHVLGSSYEDSSRQVVGSLVLFGC